MAVAGVRVNGHLANVGIGASPQPGEALTITKAGVGVMYAPPDANGTTWMEVYKGNNGTVTGGLDARGNFHTNLAVFISGGWAMTLNPDGTVASVTSANTGTSSMLDVFSDTDKGIVVRASPTATGNYTNIDNSGNFTWNMTAAGAQQWGAGNFAALDTSLSRTAASTLAVGNGAAGDGTGILKCKTDVTAPGTVAQLPSSPVEGMRAAVTDATAALAAGIGTIVAGTGANHVPVYYDGTNWRIG